MKDGYIYTLKNKSFEPCLVKIGRTADMPDSRAKKYLMLQEYLNHLMLFLLVESLTVLKLKREYIKDYEHTERTKSENSLLFHLKLHKKLF